MLTVSTASLLGCCVSPHLQLSFYHLQVAPMAASPSKPSQLSLLPARMAQSESLTLSYRLASDILGLIAEALCD